ncbi:hypothetical protein M413DRAFT_28085 [Hebeloma cylindrosporum]|uniref:BTB domain-containing protein n=1 Tax=Hebeloma cylindrosporum TaxID=76867 RepID=A0A0C3BWJ8_HEBCY|nr:hypothetical protein M413DRAFT_28085 [Hebeloma cylindrosporum h7]
MGHTRSQGLLVPLYNQWSITGPYAPLSYYKVHRFQMPQFHHPLPSQPHRNMTEPSTPATYQLAVKPVPITPLSSASPPKPPMSSSQISQTSLQYQPEKQYYHQSGDLVFVVEGILFKIHRFQLERALGVNSDPIPLGAQQLLQGVAEKNLKIQFLHDKAEEFRALCWALYAPPHEIVLQHTASHFKLDLILNVFLISHKYCLESLQTFAHQILVSHCNATCKIPELERVLRLSIGNKASPVTKAVEQALLHRLEEDRLGTISTARLITLAEELGMRDFQGKLYYHELVRDEASILKIPSSTAYNFPCTGNLTEKQLLALFHGYRSLLRYWRHLPSEVREKTLPKLASCEDHWKCQSEWNSAWNSININASPPNLDVLAALEKIRTSLPNSLKPNPPFPFPSPPFAFIGSPTPATPAPNLFVTPAPAPAPNPFATPAPAPVATLCPLNAQRRMQPCGQKELDDLIKRLEDTLADHFLGSHLP